MKKITFAFLSIFLLVNIKAQNKEWKVSLLTCTPGKELYASYGHTAIRIQGEGIDNVYNYGTFDFSEPNFYLKFSTGYLPYFIEKDPYSDFIYMYSYFRRDIREDVLDVSESKVKEIYKYLEWNLLPENREYFYDFISNNCATKVADVFEMFLADTVDFSYKNKVSEVSYRNMFGYFIDDDFAWADFGIDLILGRRVDSMPAGKRILFLPDQITKYYQTSYLKNSHKKFIRESTFVNNSQKTEKEEIFPTPNIFFSLLFIISIIIIFNDAKKTTKKRFFMFNAFISIITILGILVWTLSIFSEHISMKSNWTLVWAHPFWIALLFLGKKTFRNHKITLFLKIVSFFYILIPLWVLFIPQDFHLSTSLLVMLLGWNMLSWTYYNEQKHKSI